MKSKQKDKKEKKEKKEPKTVSKKKEVVPALPAKKVELSKEKYKDEATKLKEDVIHINETMMNEGERLFFTRLPEKIIELTEYIQVRGLINSCFVLTFYRISPYSRTLLMTSSKRYP